MHLNNSFLISSYFAFFSLDTFCWIIAKQIFFPVQFFSQAIFLIQRNLGPPEVFIFLYFHSFTLWHNLSHSRTFSHTLAHSGTLWHTLAHSSTLSHTLAHSSTRSHTVALARTVVPSPLSFLEIFLVSLVFFCSWYQCLSVSLTFFSPMSIF